MRIPLPFPLLLATLSVQASAQDALFEQVHRMLPVTPVMAFTSAQGMGDLDGDSSADLIGAMGILLNDGAGRFAQAPSGHEPPFTTRALGDVDGDGDLDALSHSGLALNDGTARFTDVTATQLPSTWSGTSFLRPLLGDVDGDGDLDVYHPKTQGQQDRLFLNDGSGSFVDVTATSLPAVATESERAFFVDVDSDGDLDLLVSLGDGHLLHLNDGAGQFAAAPSPLPAHLQVGTRIMDTGDVDGDGIEDLLLRRSGDLAALALGDGAGGFVDVTATRLGPGVEELPLVQLADVDGDGSVDLIAETAVPVFVLRSASGRWDGIVRAYERPLLAARVLGDFDRDGDLDAWVGGVVGCCPPLPQNQRLLLGRGDGQLVDVTASDLPDEALDSLGSISLEDLDADGDLDLVATATSYPSLSQGVVVYDNDGSGRFRDITEERLPSFVLANFGAALIDANGDGTKDIIAATPTRILLGDGAGGFQDAPAWTIQGLTGYPRILGIDDVDLDGDEDLILVVTGGAAVFLSDGVSSFSAGPPLAPTGGLTHTALLEDFDGDGDPDLLLGAFDGTFLFRNEGAGLFVEETATHFPAPGLGTRIAQACDADGDGDQDLLLVDYGANLRLFLGDGNGAFQDATATSFTPSAPTARTLIIGNVDDDGAPDLVVSSNDLYSNDGAGHFTLAPNDTFDLGVSQLMGGWLGDVDSDGDDDLLGRFGQTANQESTHFADRIYRNLAVQLALRSTPRQGQPLSLDLYGPPGAAFSLWVRPAPAGGAILGWSLASVGALDAHGRASYARVVPDDPALIGARLEFVARVGARATQVEMIEVTGL